MGSKWKKQNTSQLKIVSSQEHSTLISKNFKYQSMLLHYIKKIIWVAVTSNKEMIIINVWY